MRHANMTLKNMNFCSCRKWLIVKEEFSPAPQKNEFKTISDKIITLIITNTLTKFKVDKFCYYSLTIFNLCMMSKNNR